MVGVIKRLKEQRLIKRGLKFNDYKDCLLKNEIVLKSHQNVRVKDMMYIMKKLIRLL